MTARTESTPAATPTPAPRHNLPAQPTPLIGREAEITQAQARLDDAGARLLTLTGPPGAGKTRLALALATSLIGRFAHGVWFVELEAARDPESVWAAIARVLGVREQAGKPQAEALLGYLRDKHALIVLDNFEQVLAAATLVSDLLAACPALTVVVTSRVPLRLRWEHELSVPALTLPPLENSGPPSARRGPHTPLTAESVLECTAVRLFVERARAVLPTFRLDAANAKTVAAICVCLDGLPLAIELAAARAKLLPVRGILERLTPRLPFLTGGARDLPVRQQTLRAAIAWSYDLLSPLEQSLFRCLGVFDGGCTAEAVTAAGPLLSPESTALSSPQPHSAPSTQDVGLIEDGLAALANQNLLQCEEQADGRARFRMLTTIQEYAIELLEAAGEADPVRGRMADHYLALAEQAEPELRGPRQPEWLDLLERDHDNLRAALAWSAAKPGRIELGLRLAGALLVFWWVRGHLREGRGWLERLLATGAGSLPARAKALMAAGFLSSIQEDYAAARAFFDESVPLLQEANDRWRLAWTLAGQCSLPGYDDVERMTLVHESLALFRRTGDPWGTAFALYNQGLLEARCDGVEAAAVHLQEALDLFTSAGEKRGMAMSQICLAGLAHRSGDDDRAQSYLTEGMTLARQLDDPGATAFALRQAAILARDEGTHGRAARLLAAAAAAATGELAGSPVRAPAVEGADPLLDSVRSALSASGFAGAWAAGWSLPPEQALADKDEGGRMKDEATASPADSSFITPPSLVQRRLTRRETEVLRLLASGRSNQAIADALVLSIKTVERHIANIYTKLDAHGRVDATAFAVRHGLL